MKTFIYLLLLCFSINTIKSTAIIESISPVSLQGGQTTISGQFDFGYYFSTLEITIISSTIQLCPLVSQESKKIICNAPSKSIAGYFYLLIKTDLETSNSVLLVYYPNVTSYTNDNTTITISGQGFNTSKIELYAVSFQGQGDYKISDMISSTTLQFKVPIFSKNGNVQLRYSSYDCPSVYLSFQPKITLITPQVTTIGGNVMIYGDFLSPTDISNSSLGLQFWYTSEINNTEITESCQYVSANYPYSIRCNIPPAYGVNRYTLKLVITIPYLRETNYQSILLPPKIESTTSLYYGEPGTITISGSSFSLQNGGNIVTIGGVPCTNDQVLIPGSAITCEFSATAPKPTDGSSLLITIVATSLEGSRYAFQYLEYIPCGSINDKPCSGNGICSTTTGFCTCFEGFTDSLCSTEIKDNNTSTTPPPPTTDNNATTTINEFSTNLAFIREYNSISNTYPVIYNMKNAIWSLSPTSPKSFNTSNNGNSSLFIGRFDGESIRIDIEVYYFKESTVINFASEDLPIDKDSVKYLITISNYSFKSTLNTMELVFLSEDSSGENCDDSKKSTFNVTSSQNSFFIDNGQSIFNARFSNRLIIDDRIYKSSINQLSSTDELYQLLESGDTKSSLLTGVKVSWFENTCEIDPNFSSLLYQPLTENNRSECKKEFARWKLILILVICPIAFIAILTTIIILARKRILYVYKDIGFKLKRVK